MDFPSQASQGRKKNNQPSYPKTCLLGRRPDHLVPELDDRRAGVIAQCNDLAVQDFPIETGGLQKSEIPDCDSTHPSPMRHTVLIVLIPMGSSNCWLLQQWHRVGYVESRQYGALLLPIVDLGFQSPFCAKSKKNVVLGHFGSRKRKSFVSFRNKLHRSLGQKSGVLQSTTLGRTCSWCCLFSSISRLHRYDC